MSAAAKLKLFKAIDFLIKVESGPDAGKAYRIQPPKITIGRDEKCQIRLTDPKTSRQQLSIKFGDEIICTDLSSRKTTLINGQPCGTRPIKPGDIISFGNTKIKFLTRTNKAAQPQLPGQSRPQLSKEKQESARNLRVFLVLLVVLIFGYLFLQETPQQREEQKLITQTDVTNQIDESNERQAMIRESAAKKRKLADKKYLQNVESHFISGFRDFQNGQYSRAIESFGTTIATDQSHEKAIQYTKTAKKKKADLIDTHLRDGARYRDKMMYNRCAAEFEKAMIYIDNINSKKYELARTQFEECRLLKTGGN